MNRISIMNGMKCERLAVGEDWTECSQHIILILYATPAKARGCSLYTHQYNYLSYNEDAIKMTWAPGAPVIPGALVHLWYARARHKYIRLFHDLEMRSAHVTCSWGNSHGTQTAQVNPNDSPIELRVINIDIIIYLPICFSRITLCRRNKG